MQFLPMFYDLTGKRCLVVGGAAVAARKAEILQRAGGRVCIIAARIGERVRELAATVDLELLPREFAEQDLHDAACVIAAGKDNALNCKISRLAQARGIPVNVVDNPRLCSFIMPSIIERGRVQIAISTGGVSPVLARLLRGRIETSIPAEFGNLARLAEECRNEVEQVLPDVDLRRRFWESMLQGEASELALAGDLQRAGVILRKRLRSFDRHALGGQVYLVDASAGDPDLLTLKAVRLMQQADVVVYEHLVAPAILDLVRRDAEKIGVDVADPRQAGAQQEITRLVSRLAREGRRVLCLTACDPHLFDHVRKALPGLVDESVDLTVVAGNTMG